MVREKNWENKLEFRIYNQTEFDTYTTTITVGGQTYTQTNQTRSVTMNGGRRINDIVLILDIPKAQDFDVSISSYSSKEFKLFVYEKTK